MKKFSLSITVLFLIVFSSTAQHWGLKTNAAHWATAGTMNLGTEIAMSRKHTLEIGAGYNPFTFNDNKKFKHWIVQPEYRFWTCESFNGHFFGIHALAAEFNVGGFDWPIGRLKDIKEHRYEGYAFGGGVSYGYQWPIAKRLNLELNIGAGYAYLLYDKYKCVKCGEKQESDVKDNYFGVTKAAVSLIYFIK